MGSVFYLQVAHLARPYFLLEFPIFHFKQIGSLIQVEFAGLPSASWQKQSIRGLKREKAFENAVALGNRSTRFASCCRHVVRQVERKQQHWSLNL
jgi:hypothetical protein